MRSLILLTLFAAFALSLAGCSTFAVEEDYDKEANFDTLRTYEWLPANFGDEEDIKGVMARNQLIDKRIRRGVNNELAHKGFQEVTSNPDFYIMYHVGLNDKIQVTDWG